MCNVLKFLVLSDFQIFPRWSSNLITWKSLHPVSVENPDGGGYDGKMVRYKGHNLTEYGQQSFVQKCTILLKAYQLTVD